MVLKENNVATNGDDVGAAKLISKIHTMQWLKHQTIPRENEQASMTRKQARHSRLPKKVQHDGQSNAEKLSSEDGRIPPSPSAWNSGGKTAVTLFPDAELVETPMRENIDELERAIQASLKSYEAQNRSGTRSRETYVEDIEENLAEDDYWSNKAHRNLPSPEHEKVKKAPDTNNNSATRRTIDATVVERPSGSSAVARKSGTVRENVNKFEKAMASTDEPSNPEKPLVVDRFGRIAGQNECHIYMGRGGRKKEAAYIEEQKKKGLLSVDNNIAQSDKVKNDYELNRTKYNKSWQNPTNGDSEVKKSLKSLGPETRSRFEVVEGASNDVHERISSQRNLRIPEASSSVKIKSRVQSDDWQAEKPRTDEISAIEASKNEAIRSQDDSAMKTESKPLHITDFNSRHNKPKVTEEDNPESTSRPALIKSPASIRRDARKFNDDEEGACAQAIIKTPDPPPGFRASSQHEIPNASDAVLQPEDLYDRLAVHDPSLYRLLMQKKMSELSLSNRTSIHSLQGAQESFVDYDNYPGIIDAPDDNAIDTFLTPEQQAANFHQLPMNYGQMANASQFPPGIHHAAIRHNFRPDDSASNYPNRQYHEGCAMACINGTDPFGNVYQVPIILPPSSGAFLPGPSNFPPTASNYGFPHDYERFSVMRNQGPLNVHQRPMVAMNAPAVLQQQGFYYPQPNFPRPLDNHGRPFNRRSAFNPGHPGNINHLPGNRQPGKIPQAVPFPRETRGRARTQQNH